MVLWLVVAYSYENPAPHPDRGEYSYHPVPTGGINEIDNIWIWFVKTEKKYLWFLEPPTYDELYIRKDKGCGDVKWFGLRLQER